MLVDLQGLEKLNGLTDLSLLGCKSLKKVSVLGDLSSLQTLDLRGCAGVPSEMIAELKRRLPDCAIESD